MILLKKGMKKRSIIIIDGSNFYHKLRDLNLSGTFHFSYSKFTESITEGTKLKAKYYCVGRIRADQKSRKARNMMAKQQSLATRLQKQEYIIQFGYLLKSDKAYHEKGVDIQIATDLLKGAFKDQYEIVYLVSSDSDLIPAIKEVKALGKQVVYIGFEHKPSFALLKTCPQSKLLTINDLLLFLPGKNRDKKK
jgi:uncharacterized LabA/DUF88 family protein